MSLAKSRKITKGNSVVDNTQPYVFMQFAPEGECTYCDSERTKGNKWFPPHTARPNCQSGKYNHCTCDTCY